MKPFTLRNWALHILFKVYYRLYYYFFGLRIIKNPKRAKMFHSSKWYFVFKSELDPNGEKHKSFLFVKFPSKTKVWVWLFWLRHFVFSNDGINWYKSPALTPWEVEIIYRPSGKKVVKYGLNAEFVKSHLNELDKLQFMVSC